VDRATRHRRIDPTFANGFKQLQTIEHTGRM
jgi:hypothetical protein